MIKQEILLILEFEKFIVASASGKRFTIAGKRITDGVIENYGFTQKLLLEYELTQSQKLRILFLHKVPLKTIEKERKYWMKFYHQFCTFLYKQKGYYDNYVATTFKNIKTFFNYLLIEKAFPIGQYHKLFKIPHQQFTPIVISPEQLNYLITNKEFMETLTPSMQEIRDIFIVGCIVGLRISDLMSIKKTNILTTVNDTYLIVHTKKTGVEVRILLPDYVLKIFNKYSKQKNNYCLPHLSYTHINKHLKLLAEKAGWTYIIPKRMSRQGRIVEILNKQGKCYRFCDHITAHTMRRTSITTLLILGVPELVVRKFSGHAQGSKEFYKYIAIANDYSDTKIKEAYKKLANLQS